MTVINLLLNLRAGIKSHSSQPYFSPPLISLYYAVGTRIKYLKGNLTNLLINLRAGIKSHRFLSCFSPPLN